jgi:formate dehydrogenase major subunit
VFSGWDDEAKAYTDMSSWSYELGPDGFAKVDPTLQHPRSVFQVMKRFYARYTPEVVSNICGCSPDEFVKVADVLTSTFTPDRAGTIMYALGWTHHSHSVQLIHTAAMLQLLLGTRRRAERPSRSRQHPGRHRLRHGVPQPAGVHRRAEGRS